jgi:hypothetical protein
MESPEIRLSTLYYVNSYLSLVVAGTDGLIPALSVGFVEKN